MSVSGATPCEARWRTMDEFTDEDRARVGALLQSVPHATVFNTIEWVEAVAEVPLPGRSLIVLTLETAGRLVAWIALTVGRERIHGVAVRTLRFAGYPLADRFALVMLPEPAVALCLLMALRACPHAWDVAVLSELYDAAECDRLHAAARSTGLAPQWRTCAVSPVLRLPFADVQALRASYGKTLRTRLGRARRKLEAAGRVNVERRLAAPEETEALIERFKDVEDRSWKGRDQVGIFSDPHGARFFAAVARRFAQSGFLDVGMLLLDQQLISYRFGFRFRNVYQDYNLAFDPAHAAYAPGRLLLDAMIESSLEEGLDAVDASRSSAVEPHLLAEWSDEVLTHRELWLFRSWRGKVLASMRKCRPHVQALRAWRAR